MGGLIEEAIEEWNALAKREENAAYRIQASRRSATGATMPPMEDREDDSSDTAFQSCPSELREEICEWFYRVVDHCDIDRDQVGTAIFYFDKYLSLSKPMNERLIQLVAMTSLYLSVKLHSTKKISVSCIASLSKEFRVDQIEKMEICIIKTLRWYLNPPTPFLYLTIASPLIVIDDSAEKGLSTTAIELSCYLLEISVGDEYFMHMRPSCIAYAAVLAAMDVLAIPNTSFLKHKLECSQDTMELCVKRLRRIHSLAFSNTEEVSREGLGPSPTTVQELS